MRAPFQILAIPYRKGAECRFCVFHRADLDQYQFVAGGGEDAETPLEAAKREIKEETGVTAESVLPLTSMACVPANVIAEKHRQLWPRDTFVIPEYAFAFFMRCGYPPVPRAYCLRMASLCGSYAQADLGFQPDGAV